MLIHPQYIVGLVDGGTGRFEIDFNKMEFKFRINHNDIKTLYKIKTRFKHGKIIDNYIVFKKQPQTIIDFFRKNDLLNIKTRLQFMRWAYLYQKLVIEKDVIKQRKEQLKINRRIKYFEI